MASYATGSDLAARHDVELIGDLANDDGSKLSRSDILAHENVTVALEDASGEVEVALIAGGRYTASDLTGLTGNSLAHLKRMVCTLAMALLFERRPGVHREMAQPYFDRKKEYLDDLRKGVNVFGIQANLDAGKIVTTGPTSLEIDQRNLLPERMGRFFPGPSQRLPTNRG